MATLLRVGAFRVHLWSHDHEHPPHVHVEFAECLSKWNLDTLECIGQDDCTRGDLRKVRRMLEEHEQEIIESWQREWERRRQADRG